jgi:hypothetical protein
MITNKNKHENKTKAPPVGTPIGTPVPAKAIHDFPGEERDPFLLFDDESWSVLEPAFLCPDGESRAEGFAQILAFIAQAIESGPESTARAVYTLKDGVRFAYKYTKVHKLAVRLFAASLIEDLDLEDEPLQLLEGAIDRAAKKAIVV